MALVALWGLGGCNKHPDAMAQQLDLSNLSTHYDTLGASSLTLNYTPWYIHQWGIEGPDGSGVTGGGPNVWPAGADGKPSGGGKETCCSDIPAAWQPDLMLTVRWLVDKKQDGKTPGYWYKAENVRVPKYGRVMGGLWAVFLPGDRVRIMVADGQKGDANDPGIRPPDNDPYIAHGAVDEEWNRLYRATAFAATHDLPGPKDQMVDLSPKKICAECMLKADRGGAALVSR
ncbi:DUF3304 domain-containing protein [Burkholderia latens]|uniref:DUF3304 domain-containing protein n=1 Tax=Burkholderia latens TaxID=488446 RepID=UPI001FD7829B|nr:DUF3304 domain-containing protein [Burkholderia latens]